MTTKRKDIDNTIDFESSSWLDYSDKSFKNEKVTSEYRKFLINEITKKFEKMSIANLEDIYESNITLG